MVRSIRVLRFAALTAAMSMPVLTLAQTPPKAKEPIVPHDKQLDAKGCAKGRVTIGEGGEFNDRKTDAGNLSDRLAQSDGVICPPPQVDPAIKAPTPEGGKMPVIPPPGSPGGDPNIRPK